MMPYNLAKQAKTMAWKPIRNRSQRIHEGVHIKRHCANVPSLGQQPQAAGQAQRHQEQAGIEKQPARTVEEKKAETPPAVEPGAEMRAAAAAIGREGRGHLLDAHPGQGGLHHHLARELHAGGVQMHAFEGSLAQAAHAAVKVRRISRQRSGGRESSGAGFPR